MYCNCLCVRNKIKKKKKKKKKKVLHKLQLVHVPSIKEVKSSFLMFHVILSSQGHCGSLEDSFDLQNLRLQ